MSREYNYLSNSEVEARLHRAHPRDLTLSDIDNMSDEEVLRYRENQLDRMHIVKKRDYFSPGDFEESGDFEALRGMESLEGAKSLRDLFERHRNSFIEYMWNTGKSSFKSDEEVINKIAGYYTRHGNTKDAALRDINRRLKELKEEGKLY